MSREMNEGVIMHFKTITTKLSTIVHLFVEPIISLAKTKASLDASIYIRELPRTGTFINPVMSPSLFIFFSSGNILISNRYWWGTVESYVGNIDDCCGRRNTTEKMKCTASRNCISVIDLIKGGYVICWGPSINWKSIVEAILSKSLQ